MCDLQDCSDCSKSRPTEAVKCQEIIDLWNEFGYVPIDDNENKYIFRNIWLTLK